MLQLSLETIAARLSELLQCEQEDLCLPILHQVSRGKPLPKAALSTSLQISHNELAQRLLHLPDTEFDQEGNIVGWGVTLLPTRHRFQMNGRSLFTWCAFDTVLFPPSLGEHARVHSTCSVTEASITFVVTPNGGIEDLHPQSAVMSLLIPAKRSECVRATFCEHSLFFQAEQAAASYLAPRRDAVLLSLVDAALVGKLVATSRFVRKKDIT